MEEKEKISDIDNRFIFGRIEYGVIIVDSVFHLYTYRDNQKKWVELDVCNSLKDAVVSALTLHIEAHNFPKSTESNVLENCLTDTNIWRLMAMTGLM